MTGAISAAPAETPVVLSGKRYGTLFLAALDQRATALGLRQGMTLADARAQVPALAVFPHDPGADRRLLGALALLCDRYTPMVGLDPPNGITLDITGCAHLLGGETQLAEDVRARFAGAGFNLRVAFAGSPEGAQALARFAALPVDCEDMALLALPIAALRAGVETEAALRRAGLRMVGDLASRPTAPLSARFGVSLVLALERLLGRTDSRIVPLRPTPALFFERRCAEPIGRTEQAMAMIGELMAEAAAALTARHAGGRRFIARLYRSDGATRDLRIETGQAVCDPDILMRLFEERIGSLVDPIDPGFGFDMVRLAVPVIEPLVPSQPGLDGTNGDQHALGALVDRLTVRLGRERVRRFSTRDTHIPELAGRSVPADTARPATCPPPDPAAPPLRPLQLFDPPQMIEVVAEVPDGPPRCFRWSGALRDVARVEGPERIAAEWWRADPGSSLTRDYYRVEDVEGRRYWIFRHGLYGRERQQPDWYLHGLFA